MWFQPSIFWHVRSKVAKIHLLDSPCLSVRPQVTTAKPLDVFSWHFILGSKIKICRPDSLHGRYAYQHFCAPLERNKLHIYRSKTCLEQNLF